MGVYASKTERRGRCIFMSWAKRWDWLGEEWQPTRKATKASFFFKQSIMIDAINSNFISVGLSYEKILESVIKCLITF